MESSGNNSGPFRALKLFNPNPTREIEKILFFYFFFYLKYISPKIISLVIYEVNIYVRLTKILKIYDILMILVDFLRKFSMILADVLLPWSVSWNGTGTGWPKWNGSKLIRIRSATLVNIYLPVFKWNNSQLSQKSKKDFFLSFFLLIFSLHCLGFLFSFPVFFFSLYWSPLHHVSDTWPQGISQG